MSEGEPGQRDSVERVVKTGKVVASEVREVLADGVARTTTPNGWRFVALFTILSVVTALLAAEVLVARPLGLGPTPPVLVGLALSGAVLLAAVVVAVRTFASGETETIPEQFITRRLLYVIVNLLVGVVVFTILIASAFVFALILLQIVGIFLGGIFLSLFQTVGQFALVVAGVFLLVTFFFWWLTVAVEDQDFVESIGVSWRLTEGKRLPLLGLIVVLTLLWGVVAAVTSTLATASSVVVALVVAALLAGPLVAFYSATVAHVYRRLRGEVSIPAA